DGAGGISALQPDRAVVRHGGARVGPLSPSPVVPPETRTVVPRHGEYVAAQKLGGKINGGGVAERPPRKMAGSRCGVGSSGRLNNPSAACKTAQWPSAGSNCPN